MRRLLFIFLLTLSAGTHAEEVILAQDDFLQEAFSGSTPAAKTLWVTGELRDSASEILGEPPRSLRFRYWRDAERSAWILDAIGKESPITAGFVIEDGSVQRAEVLIYRESRGGEIRFHSFLRQFPGLRLQGQELSRPIDNISSATLSVRAMQRMAKLALLFDAHSS